jgi:NAD(P)-dependent dehydrogenase (short-subunit alcohol dehydrogenase family)
VRDEDGVAALAARVYDEFGRCDLLVNNAAFAPPKPALQDTVKKWRVAIDVNLNGPFYFIYYFGPRMAETEGGARMVHISSAAAYAPEFGRASYTATKRGLEGLSDSIGQDLKGKVASNTVRIDIPVWTEGFDDTLDAGGGFEFEIPEIVSDAVLWLAREPLEHTSKIHTLTALREEGVLRPRALHGA